MKKDEIRDLVAKYNKERWFFKETAVYNSTKKTITISNYGELPQSQALKIIRKYLSSR